MATNPTPPGDLARLPGDETAPWHPSIARRNAGSTERRIVKCVLETAQRARRGAIAQFKAARSNLAPIQIPEIGERPGPALLPDAGLSEQFYAGRFNLGGIMVDTVGFSPFELSGAPTHWQQRLNSFAWLRHLQAADSTLAQKLARSLLEEWLQVQGPVRAAEMENAVWNLAVTAERLISWITHSSLLTASGDATLIRQFHEAIARHVRHLRNRYDVQALTSEHLMAALALAFAAHTLRSSARSKASARRQLSHILARQCGDAMAARDALSPAFADPHPLVHVCRRPSVAMELIPILVSTTSAIRIHTKNVHSDAATTQLVKDLDCVSGAMARWISIAQHSDGGLAVFNGAKEESLERVTGVLAVGVSDGRPLRPVETCGGYTRLAASGTTVICDVGPTPPVGVSAEAQAGTLGFELSSGGERVIVNCGTPEEAYVRSQNKWRMAARQTAAHSALAIAGHSSSSAAQSNLMQALTGNEIVDALARPNQRTGQHGDGRVWLNAEHDGYKRKLGLLHRRAIALSPDGRLVEFEDTLSRVGGVARSLRPNLPEDGSLPIDVRFHLAPGCRAKLKADRTVAIQSVGGRIWTLDLKTDAQFALAIAPSLQINHPGGPKAIQQIVASGAIEREAKGLTLEWQLSL
ncbi:MAG: heparinase II/III family protein [Pseudomonadota bacterium]